MAKKKVRTLKEVNALIKANEKKYKANGKKYEANRIVHEKFVQKLDAELGALSSEQDRLREAGD